MEIKFKTKFDLGQKAVVFNKSKKKLQEIEISEVQFEIGISGTQLDINEIETSIWYRDKTTFELFKEQDLYTSRDEFIAQL